MAHKYVQIAFTETVRAVQTELNSRQGYAGMDQGEDYNYLLSQNEADFIAERDSFYMASVSETLWPYLQHRGGPKGFMRVLDQSTLGFADFSGNRQYVSTGNFRNNDRVALFFMDYPNRRRLKMMGRIELVADNNWELLAKLEVTHYRARVERGFLIHIEGFDWNCPQHITPRYTELEYESVLAPLLEENQRLKQQVLQSSTHASPNGELSSDQGNVTGTGELPLVITGIRQLTPRVRAYEFRHRDDEPLPSINAGAHLQLLVTLKNGALLLRHYSICSNPKRRDIYEIAVLNEPDGQGGSRTIHNVLHLGQQLNCAAPENYFPLHSDARPTVLIAGGIGITPIKAMAQTLQSRGTQFHLHYAGRSLTEMPFQERLARQWPEQLSRYPSDQGKRLNIKEVLQGAIKDAIFYVCGPNRLIDEVAATAKALGISDEQVKFERFTAPSTNQTTPYTLTLSKSQQQIQVNPEQSMLDAILSAGIEHPHSCKTGQCKSCVVKVISGQVTHQDDCLTPAERAQQNLMCPCVSHSKSETLVLDL
ncbi:2Fe-2S iron-sulfur cluster binding domain-containing protein [Motilimonas cestriensis]|uniref:2Fe-2S iron-sulfur cluster binding domain-containing protein n=1 Tax=Motilimonas cestriensis TaxID=2742685 RepID=A0ABS8WC64_9GAMM|nr:2Fe-2S iron-sulfur cluster-binding protein [Motilimonas cestriensis]MCE2596619.1 2Fe-2S iron-sulfur cluster binding domain-containing protein [Motilimonas cestriensis]